MLLSMGSQRVRHDYVTELKFEMVEDRGAWHAASELDTT